MTRQCRRAGRRTALLAAALCGLVHVARAASCTVTPSGLAFGNYDPSSAIPTDTTGTITVSCSAAVAATTTYTLALSAGTSGTIGQRTLTSGHSTLNYQLYSDPTRSVVWGDGTGGSSTVTGSIIVVLSGVTGSGSQIQTVFGRIPAGQLSVPASYSDTILLTVAY